LGFLKLIGGAMSEEMKKGKITFNAKGLIEIADDSQSDISQLNEDQRGIVRQLGQTVEAYLTAAEEFLNSKYAHLKDWAPIHLVEPGNVLVASCLDGVVIRYERRVDKKRIIGAWFPEKLPQLASILSQSVVHCHMDRNYTSNVPSGGTEVTLFKETPGTRTREEIVSARVGLEAVIEKPERLPQPPQKPFCLLSVLNNLEIHLLGEVLQEDASAREGQHFLVRSAIRLPVGWECIEVYPFFDREQWKPDYAPFWAENDLLATVVGQQFRESHFQSLDPKAEARRQVAELLKSYKDLLDSNPEREEVLQRFLRDHPFLLCPTHTKMWPKLALGARETDFVFQEAIGDYLLVELERATYRLFLKDGHPSRELNHAHGQITDWKRYLEDNLSTVQRELGLKGISTNPKSLIVIGRSRSLTHEDRRKLITIENESPKTKIMTYDDVLENAKAVAENLRGPLWESPINTRIYYLQGS
jgi:hypothetical protein